MLVHDIHTFTHKHQLANQYCNNQAVALLLMEHKVCCITQTSSPFSRS